MTDVSPSDPDTMAIIAFEHIATLNGKNKIQKVQDAIGIAT